MDWLMVCMTLRLEARLNRTRQKLDEALAQAAELRGSGRTNAGASGSGPSPSSGSGSREDV